ncbi:peptidoglycan-binding domain-containing protein [Nitrincola sp.]|uniref:peptidoglycan-binding domain-containing protein n=1 Tax=Nitrincola sp. TaxID=1926584 RepID=UPI003A9075D6
MRFLSVIALAISTALVSPAILSKPVNADMFATTQSGSTRNHQSSPSTSILPFSPAITDQIDDGAPASIVLLVKSQLLKLGYEPGSLDGEITGRFRMAVFQFQRNRQLNATGTIDLQTTRELGIAIE